MEMVDAYRLEPTKVESFKPKWKPTLNRVDHLRVCSHCHVAGFVEKAWSERTIDGNYSSPSACYRCGFSQ